MKKQYEVGDIVLFYRKPYDSELIKDGSFTHIKGTKLSWFSDIEEDLGKVGKVIVAYSDRCKIRFKDNTYSYYIPNFLLKQIRKEKLKRILYGL